MNGTTHAAAGRYPHLHRAVNLAALWHTGQDRKYTSLPYIVHPLRVMSLVREVSDNEDMLIAAVLHDVVEDTPVSLDTIRDEFGDRAADLVGWLTDVSTPADGNRAARKAIDAEHTVRAPADAQTIKLADLIDNTASITRGDPHFARVYMAEKERLLGVLTKGDARLHERATASLAAYQTDRLQEALRHG